MSPSPPTMVEATTSDMAVNGSGQAVYSVYDGETGAGRVYRSAAREGATPEDLSTSLDALSPAALDAWITMSHDWRQFAMGTERFDPACMGWPCLAVVSADLSSAKVVRTDGEVGHPNGPGAIAGNTIVFPTGDGPRETHLWVIGQQGERWSTLILLTGESPYAHRAAHALTVDGTRVVFECGDRPYGEAETALCEVGTDGLGFRVIFKPTDAANDLPATTALRHPSYAPDGAIVLGSSWDAAIWRLPRWRCGGTDRI